jgi:hypothetical protein
MTTAMSCDAAAAAMAAAPRVMIEFAVEFAEEAGFQDINLEEETDEEEPVNNDN